MPSSKLLILVVCSFVTSVSTSSAQIVEKWVQRYDAGAPFGDEAHSVVVDGMGNIIVTGTSHKGFSDDFLTIKYAPDGTVLWEQRFNGPDNKADETPVVAVDASGNVIVAGKSGSLTSGDDYQTIKYAAADGAVLWQHRYNGTGNSDDRPSCVAVDSSGNVIVSGSSYGVDGNWDYLTVKLAAANGAELWVKRYDSFVVSNNRDQVHAMALDGAGNVIVTGQSTSAGTGQDYYTIKYAAADGTQLWARRFNGVATDVARSVAVDASGDVVVTGYSNAVGRLYDYFTIKYSGLDGTTIWSQPYDATTRDDYAYSVALDAEGNAVVTGGSTNLSNFQDVFTIKYAGTDGTVLWQQRHDGPAGGDDSGQTVRVDSLGRVIVSGYHLNVGNSNHNDFYTAQYAGGDGSLLWERIYNGVGGIGLDIIQSNSSLALTPNDDVVITGASKGAFTMDYATIRYGQATPLDLWRQTHFGTTRNNDTAANTADPDHDGLVNLLELAFNQNPTLPSAGGLPPVANEGGFMTMTITKQPGAAYEVQSAGTLLPALPDSFSASSTTVLINNATTLKVRDNTLFGTPPARFMRVQVTGAP